MFKINKKNQTKWPFNFKLKLLTTCMKRSYNYKDKNKIWRKSKGKKIKNLFEMKYY
jgi:hypothetical protein